MKLRYALVYIFLVLSPWLFSEERLTPFAVCLVFILCVFMLVFFWLDECYNGVRSYTHAVFFISRRLFDLSQNSSSRHVLEGKPKGDAYRYVCHHDALLAGRFQCCLECICRLFVVRDRGGGAGILSFCMSWRREWGGGTRRMLIGSDSLWMKT